MKVDLLATMEDHVRKMLARYSGDIKLSDIPSRQGQRFKNNLQNIQIEDQM